MTQGVEHLQVGVAATGNSSRSSIWKQSAEQRSYAAVVISHKPFMTHRCEDTPPTGGWETLCAVQSPTWERPPVLGLENAALAKDPIRPRGSSAGASDQLAQQLLIRSISRCTGVETVKGVADSNTPIEDSMSRTVTQNCVLTDADCLRN